LSLLLFAIVPYKKLIGLKAWLFLNPLKPEKLNTLSFPCSQYQDEHCHDGFQASPFRSSHKSSVEKMSGELWRNDIDKWKPNLQFPPQTPPELTRDRTRVSPTDLRRKNNAKVLFFAMLCDMRKIVILFRILGFRPLVLIREVSEGT
jgi:hypothetical protein